MRAFLTEAGRSHGFAIIFDDLHWADMSSLMALRFVSRSLRDVPVFLLGTYREANGSLRACGRALGFASACGECSTRSARRPHDGSRYAPGRVLHWARSRAVRGSALREWTGGNPFFLTHVVPIMTEGIASALVGEQPLACSSHKASPAP